jgi:hypothetical protein
MTRFRTLSAASTVLALTFTAVSAAAQSVALSGSTPAANATVLKYGAPARIGNGMARLYVELDASGKAATEIGIAFDAEALNGLPAAGAGHHGQHADVHEYLFELPTEFTAPFHFVEVNWNPAGHEPEGVYQDVPHFDFHFYTITKAARDAIDPADAQYAAKANDIPTGDFVPPFTAVLGPPGAPPAAVAVPKMGVHWTDMRSPELQKLLGNEAAYRPFTATFIHGTWGGRYIFWEPMITRAHMLAKREASDPAVRDEIIPIPVPAKYQASGRYPTAYRVAWDPEAREYRVALTGLTARSGN